MAEKEARRFKRIYDRRAGAIALHPSDKVLIRLDSFVGQRRKLKNRWGSQIHTVVRHVADGMPTYVVRNDRSGGKIMLHRVRLLLWIANCINWDDGVSVNLAIAAPMIVGSAEEGQIVNRGEPNDGQIEAQVIPAGVLQKGVGHITTADKGDIPPMVGDTTLTEDVPP